MDSQHLKSQANDALLDEDYDLALDLFDKAIKSNGQDADLFAKRAAAHIKLREYEEAVADATRAIQLDPKHFRGYMMKGEAAFKLDEFETARDTFQKAQELGAPGSKCKLWLQKCQAELEDDGMEVITPLPTGGYKTPKPASQEAFKPAAKASPPQATTVGQSSAGIHNPSQASNREAAEASNGQQEPKYRYQFFQTQSIVEVAVLAKNLSADRVSVSIEEQRLGVVILDESGKQEYELKLDLNGEVDPSKSRHTILKSKLEIVLQKAANVSWPKLMADEHQQTASPILQVPVQQPSYPTSFKRHPVDWDRLESDLKKEEKDEKLDGEAGLQKLFKGIYAGADEDTRRAMNKSFQESNGTVLSTNWKEISAKKTESKS